MLNTIAAASSKSIFATFMRFPFETIFPCAPRPSRRDLPFRAVVSLCPTVSHHDKRWIRALHARPATSHASRHAPCNPALFTSRPCDLPSSHISTPRNAPSIIAAPPHCGMCRDFWTNRQGSRMPEHQSKSCTKVFPGKMPGRNDAGKVERPRATQSGHRFAEKSRQT